MQYSEQQVSPASPDTIKAFHAKRKKDVEQTQKQSKHHTSDYLTSPNDSLISQRKRGQRRRCSRKKNECEE
jgi:hypothetical protein